MQGGRENPEFVYSSASEQAAEEEADGQEDSEGCDSDHSAAEHAAEAVRLEQIAREEVARRVARAGGIELVAARERQPQIPPTVAPRLRGQ